MCCSRKHFASPIILCATPRRPAARPPQIWNLWKSTKVTKNKHSRVYKQGHRQMQAFAQQFRRCTTGSRATGRLRLHRPLCRCRFSTELSTASAAPQAPAKIIGNRDNSRYQKTKGSPRGEPFDFVLPETGFTSRLRPCQLAWEPPAEERELPISRCRLPPPPS